MRISPFTIILFACHDIIKNVVNFEVSVEHERIRKVSSYIHIVVLIVYQGSQINTYNSYTSIEEKRFMLKIYLVARLVVDCTVLGWVWDLHKNYDVMQGQNRAYI